MTDKQIIIDGVDVSKCIYFQQEDDEYTCGAEECNGAIVACRACDNCYYKQLKRKEQECEEMRIYIESNEQQVKEVETLVMDNDRLINELDQLKEQLEAYKMEAEEGKEINAELKAENEEWKKANGCILTTLNVIAEGNKKLRQTLTEIKEIIRNQGHIDILEEQILQKISECEGSDELTK